MTIPSRKIYALTETDAREIDRQHGAWTLWHAIGARLGVNFNPDVGPICSVERTGWLSIAVSWHERKCRKPPTVIEIGAQPFVMPRYQARLS